MANLISKAELAIRAGTTAAAVTHQLRSKLAGAIVGDLIDSDHPSVIAWLATRAANLDKQRERNEAAGKPGVADYDKLYGDLGGLAEIIRPIVDKNGTKKSFKDWLEALKRIEDIRKTRLDNDRTEELLIERDLVKKHVFGAIESAFRRLLVDTTKTATARVYAAAKAGRPIEEAEEILRDLIHQQLKPLKGTAARNLRKKSKV